MTQDIRTTIVDGVLEILFDRPAKKNALSDAMYLAFADALLHAEAEKSVKAVLICGAGDDFCAGNDLVDFARAREHRGGLDELPVGRVLRALAATTKPVVAAVQGKAIGIGTTMLLHCDLVFVAPDARLSAPFVNLALVPEAASSLLLPIRIGHVRAFELFVLGAALSGEEAVALGLANRAVPADGVAQAAREAALALAAKPAGAVAATKQLMREVEAIQQRIDAESAAFGERLVSAEAQEVFAAFIEKRPPDFSRIG
ncbi:enoyl-CoA hydratase-related protein [Novosphingobium sp. CCH12-A3]|uniref:enoyl-CoA hydratase-related protein n=1 Tax=Novosphingobium sp. CCH12-A3 TaxID=1768752 RepID=UPI000781E167|nr:enoyl-CoA hydratase-related protein [Novosphingobium sp. CCH12-A3]